MYSRLLSGYLLALTLARVRTHVCLRWRAGFYIAGEDDCVGNFIVLLDEFLVWKTKATQKDVQASINSLHVLIMVRRGDRWFWQVHIFQGALKVIDNEAIEQLTYEQWTLHDDEGEEMPLKWYECQPVISKKIVVMHLESRS